MLNVKAQKYEYYEGYTSSSLKWIRNANRYDKRMKLKIKSSLSWASFIKAQSGIAYTIEKLVPITSEKRLRKINKELGF